MPPLNLHITLPSNTPAAVPPANATKPKKIISTVCKRKNLSADIVRPVPNAKKIVTILQSAFCDVSDNLSVTPDSRNKLPSINIPIKEAIGGNNKLIMIVAIIGNTIRSNLVTSLN